ncbi:MAG: ATPase domain-containing protein [Methanosarcinales archaeon]|nr:ATPase domain-containing protein [Methanosarcinales archaeon]
MDIKKTYIPRLDEILGGGVPKGTSILFQAMPGIISDVFGYQIISQRAYLDKDVGFIYTNTRTPAEIERVFDRYGWDLRTPLQTGTLFFVDSISEMMGVPSIGKFIINDLAKSEDILLRAIEDVSGGTAVFENVATLIDSIGADKTLELMEIWNGAARKNNVNMVYIFTRWDYEDKVVERLKTLVDCEIELFGIEEKVMYRQVFMVVKSNWTIASKCKTFFELTEPGGIKVFIPKLLVTGPYNAGKTTFVHAIAKEAVSVERQAFELFPTTVGLDIGHVDYKGFSADVFGTPGQERFDLLLEPLARESIGTFIIIDSTRPETFTRAKEMINMCRAEAIPKVIVANKSDLPNALTPDEIKKRMALWEDVQIVPVSALNNKGVHQALDALFELIYRV